MSATATAIAGWVSETPLIDGVLFGSSDGEVDGPPVCAVAVAGSLRGYGKGVTQSEALASAVGEVLELFSASRVDSQRLVRASFAELGESAFDPRWLGLYSAEQYGRAGFPFRPFCANEPLHWIEGRWLGTTQAVYLPAFAVYLANEFAGEALSQASSNGLAAAESVEQAIDHAVLELYERDAFLRSWHGLLPKRKLMSGDRAGILAHLAARGAETEVYLIADSPVAVAAALAIGDGVVWPAFTLGLGGAHDVESALDKAILELGQTAPFLARQWRGQEVLVPANAHEIRTLRDHALFYCDASQGAVFERWRSTPDGPLAVNEKDIRIAAVDITPTALSGSPYRVVRAVAWGLQPVSCGYGLQRLSGEFPNHAPHPLC